MSPSAATSLKRRNAALAHASEQLHFLQPTSEARSFNRLLVDHGLDELRANGHLDVLQVNVGKMCNMTCRHCHVDAGPDRREMMTRETVDACLAAIRSARTRILDLTVALEK